MKERGRDFNQGYTWGHLDDHANVLDRVQLLAGPLRGKRVLEVGAGPGYVQKAMHDMGESIEGWERNGLLVDLAKSHGLTITKRDLLRKSMTLSLMM